ncbi:MAG: type I CRISPR-associated protein Cas7 [Planctomycetia bacterium]|nr:type I CRISPR-associated protein Cas7 [Planctomycetia bacterium]
MGRKKTISYGLYAGYGFVSPNLAAQTGFDEVDLEIFREAFKICLNMNTVPLVEE